MTLKLTGLLIIIICSTNLFGQYVLDTPDGKKVKLNENGTWTFIKEPDTKKLTEIPQKSTAKYLSRLKKYELWFDPTQWSYDTTRDTNSFTWDVQFLSIDYAITGYWLDSRLSMPIEGLEETIRQQWQTQGDIKSFVISKDTINNLPLIVFEMQLLYKGLTYQYRGLVYSSEKGSFQFIVGTQKEIFDEDKEKIDLLFRGINKL